MDDKLSLEKEEWTGTMQIDQDKFFKGLNFERYEINGEVCFKGPDAFFYRMDHFSMGYVIEYAENEEEARINRFWDADLFDDNLEEDELIRQIQDALREYVLQ